MNLPHIQSELFRELLVLENKLKPECGFFIVKEENTSGGYIRFWLMRKEGCWTKTMREDFLNPHAITTPDKITAEINRIWNAIPAEYKKDPLK